MQIKNIGEIGIPAHLSYAESGPWLEKFCQRNNALYYARPREDFSVNEAMALAKSGNHTMVILEDMS
jgi:hypothetical protein